MGTDLQSHEVELDQDASIATMLEDYATIARDELPAGLGPILDKAIDHMRREQMNNEVEAYPGELAELRSRVRDFEAAEKKLGKAVVMCMEYFDAEQLGGRIKHDPAEVLDLLEDGSIGSWLAGLQKRNLVRFRRFPVRK